MYETTLLEGGNQSCLPLDHVLSEKLYELGISVCTKYEDGVNSLVVSLSDKFIDTYAGGFKYCLSVIDSLSEMLPHNFSTSFCVAQKHSSIIFELSNQGILLKDVAGNSIDVPIEVLLQSMIHASYILGGNHIESILYYLKYQVDNSIFRHIDLSCVLATVTILVGVFCIDMFAKRDKGSE